MQERGARGADAQGMAMQFADGLAQPRPCTSQERGKLLLRCNAGETMSGVLQHHPSMMLQHDAGNNDAPAATFFGGMRSPAQASTAQPPDRPHGMLGE